eukprot:1426689-Rhodomonas_salina.2
MAPLVLSDAYDGTEQGARRIGALCAADNMYCTGHRQYDACFHCMCFVSLATGKRFPSGTRSIYLLEVRYAVLCSWYKTWCRAVSGTEVVYDASRTLAEFTGSWYAPLSLCAPAMRCPAHAVLALFCVENPARKSQTVAGLRRACAFNGGSYSPRCQSNRPRFNDPHGTPPRTPCALCAGTEAAAGVRPQDTEHVIEAVAQAVFHSLMGREVASPLNLR